MPTLMHYLVLSALLLGAGVATILLKRNPLGVLMGIEMILNAAMLNVVAFDAFAPPPNPGSGAEGRVFALFIILIAAAQAALVVAIVLNYQRSRGKAGGEGA